MEGKYFKEFLLKHLDDKEVIEKIKEIINSSQKSIKTTDENNDEDYKSKFENVLYKMEKEKYRELEEKVIVLKNDLNRKEETIKERENNLNEEKIKNEKLREKVESNDFKISKLENENMHLKENSKSIEEVQKENNEVSRRLNELLIFERWVDIFRKFNSLNEETIKSLKGIFRGDNILEFIYCGVQESNINNFWDYIKDRALNESDELEVLEEIFNEFFKAINKIYENEVYEIQEVNIDDEFDDDYYIRTSSSNPVGTIKKVLLKGYVQKGNKKIIKKSIVQI